jgi:hypothetical protein
MEKVTQSLPICVKAQKCFQCSGMCIWFIGMSAVKKCRDLERTFVCGVSKGKLYQS